VKKKIVITGGHLTPALAVIDELQKEDSWEIHFIGRKYASEWEKTPSKEAEIIADRGIWFHPLAAGRFPRHFNRYTAKSFFKVPLGFFQALYLLLKIRPKVILSFGLYLSVPVVFAGWVLRIPSLTHEQTAVKGLANKVNAVFVNKVVVSWPQTVSLYPPKKVVLTGNPVRQEIFKVNPKIFQTLKYDPKLPLVFITGGNQGSHVINKAVKEVLPKLVKLTNVFHQCGHLKSMGDFENLETAREKLPSNLKKRYHVRKYVPLEEMGTFLGKADLVVSRAGANTVTEIAALGKMALLIPLPWNYADEQTKNAQLLVESGIAEILPQSELSGRTLYENIESMIENQNQYGQNSSQAKKMVNRRAAEKIAREVAKLA
jgi:UDP-N-acetylglucosamine--N-acetylmuramyl-(pentapeptide) pyrophosphoryl-undecaprenol N-acetylglucosamine transferase